MPRPDLAARAGFLRRLLQARYPAMTWEMTPEQLAAETGGLALVQIEDIVQRARGARAPLARASIVERKIELLRQEYGDVLEILQPALRPLRGRRARARGHASCKRGGGASCGAARPRPRRWASSSWARPAPARATWPSASPRSAGCSACASGRCADVRRPVRAQPGEGVQRDPRAGAGGGDRGRVGPGRGRQPRPGLGRLRRDRAHARRPASTSGATTRCAARCCASTSPTAWT